MFDLNYKARNIRDAEKDYGLSFFKAIEKIGSSDIDITSLMFLYACGGAADEDFEKDFEKSMQDVVVNIFKHIDEAGFLGVKLETDKMAQEIEPKKEKTSASTKSGEKTNA